ncbi:hypothetical protein BSZ39_10685 [Bowdeniella nasicola]|uniref:PNPLA domain-containing protein n=1 Tax=Bowdeniella nasicola TaxID=208480 RepID=A0A1Q5Q0A6_9ACTO|nr:patatin-like phospholipase family protein [Bowdeniella nasicola]OKL53217.1 hypothetical protein BSZ39_10685 [Bowdeniella nasicola]
MSVFDTLRSSARRLLTGAPPPEKRRGLVLAGGGARASFQLGALHRLIAVEGMHFDAIAGTSAGAILGGVVAQYRDAAGQQQAVADLSRLWREMTGPSDMFTERTWFELLQHQAPVWQRIMRSDAASRTPRTIEIPSFTWPFRRGETSEPTTVSLPQLPQAFTAISDLWSVAGPGSGFDSIARGALTSSSIFTPGPLVDRILAEAFDPARLARSGVPARFALVSLETGALRYVDAYGQLRDRDDRPLGIEVDLVDAIAASCAIPAVFPPVRLADGEHYVDGGVRMSLPADIMLDHLPVDETYAICSAPAGVQEAESFADSNIVSTIVRSSATLMNEELARQELARARAGGAIVIDPQTEVHDAMTVAPGLIRISMDYGYLRASQVLAGASVEEQDHARHLVEIRRLIWALQAQEQNAPPLFGAEDVANQILAAARRAATPESDEPDLESLQATVRDLTLALPGSQLPPGSSTWGRRDEFITDGAGGGELTEA